MEWSETGPHDVESLRDEYGTLVVDLLDLMPRTEYDYQVVFIKDPSTRVGFVVKV